MSVIYVQSAGTDRPDCRARWEIIMLDRVLRQANILEKGLDASWKRNEVIAGNIANADTPGYQSKSVNFESVFRQALKPDSFALRESTSASQNPKYLAFSDQTSAVSVTQDRATAMRMDGNNVDIDKEMTDLAKNQILYDTLTYTMAKELGRIKTVLTEGT